ncbi:hypothetical protein [Nodularia spumigena]|uniref:hypothetical protein n=1 Tax=Nodularia spumigena TaxID=70799 RepID=UPI000315EE79|nr:hypothetical protein [Nodularia spumigena]AHJ30341.1 hypothetical protein NSP_40410 [Nodularia spumigena CCY9414]
MYLYATLSDKFILLLRRGYWRSLLFDPTSQNRVAPGKESINRYENSYFRDSKTK